MNVLLLHCSSFAGNDISHPRVEHLGIAYLAAVARQKGHQVSIIDANIEKLRTPALLARLQAFSTRFDLIGFSVISTNYAQTREVVAALRHGGYAGHICFGGYFPSFLAESVYRDCEGVDSILQGEAEHSFCMLLEALDSCGEWRDIAGVIFWEGKELIRNAPPPLVADLDQLPFPVRDTLPTLLKHRNPVVSVSPARGCYMKCNFCSIIEFYKLSQGRAWRERSPDNILDEIEIVLSSPVCRQQKVDFVWFCADEFVGLKKDGIVFARRFAEAVLRRNVRFRWEIACRTDQVDYELFRLMKEAGLRSVYVGAESFSQRQLDSYNKHNTVERNWEAIRVFQRLNIDYTLGTIVFSPDTTLEEFEDNHKAISEIGYRHVTMPLSRLKLFHGTQAAKRDSRSLPVLQPKASIAVRDVYSAVEHDSRFPLDDVYGYEFLDRRVAKLWRLLSRRNDLNERLVREVVSLLNDRLIDGVTFWKLVFAIRDGLAWFIDDALRVVRATSDLRTGQLQQNAVIRAGLTSLRKLRSFLKKRPEVGQSLELTFGGVQVHVKVSSTAGFYLPGVEKDVAEREHETPASDIGLREILIAPSPYDDHIASISDTDSSYQRNHMKMHTPICQ